MDYSEKLKTMRRYVDRFDAYQETREVMTEISGDLVKEWREIAHISLRRFARKLEVTPGFLSKVERGIEPLPPNVARRILEMHK